MLRNESVDEVGRTGRTEGGAVEEDGAVIPFVQLGYQPNDLHSNQSMQQRLPKPMCS